MYMVDFLALLAATPVKSLYKSDPTRIIPPVKSRPYGLACALLTVSCEALKSPERENT